MHQPPILNFEKKIDRIVGKNTVRALDLELPPLDEKPPVLQSVDIVVRYQGAGNAVLRYPISRPKPSSSLTCANILSAATGFSIGSAKTPIRSGRNRRP